MEILTVIVIALVIILALLVKENTRLSNTLKVTDTSGTRHFKEIVDLQTKNKVLESDLLRTNKQVNELNNLLVEEKEKNEKVVSQSKSSQSNIGLIGEQLVPFLQECPFEPRTMHFIGAPIDFLVVDFDQAEIHLVEVKTGQSKLSKRQKIIKNIIKMGKVYYSEIRINDKGVKYKKIENEE